MGRASPSCSFRRPCHKVFVSNLMILRVSNDDDDGGEMLARAISSVKTSVWLCWQAGSPHLWNSLSIYHDVLYILISKDNLII